MRYPANIIIMSILLFLLNPAFAESSKNSVRISSEFNKLVPGKIDFDCDEAVEVKLMLDLGFIFVDIFLNAQGPFRFLVDTGSDTSILSQGLVKKLNIEPIESYKKIFHTSHSKAEIDTFLYNIELLKMGSIKFTKVPFIASNTASDDFQLLKELNIMGIIGANVFYDIILTLDLPRQKILLTQKNSKLSNAKNIVKFNHEHYLPIIKTTVVNQMEKINYDFLIDTGYTGFVQMPICFPYKNTHEANDIKSYDVFKESNSGFLSELNGTWMIGTNEIENPMVKYTFGACERPLKWGLIGTRFLEHHVVTIDQQKREVILH